MSEQPAQPSGQDRHWLAFVQKLVQKMREPLATDEGEGLKIEIERELTEADLARLREVDRHVQRQIAVRWRPRDRKPAFLREVDRHVQPGPATHVPVTCEWLLCVTVEPEFQEDRLADYQERFTDLWVPKFGPRIAVLLYAWHVVRQSRFIDWLIRTIRPFG